MRFRFVPEDADTGVYGAIMLFIITLEDGILPSLLMIVATGLGWVEIVVITAGDEITV